MSDLKDLLRIAYSLQKEHSSTVFRNTYLWNKRAILRSIASNVSDLFEVHYPTSSSEVKDLWHELWEAMHYKYYQSHESANKDWQSRRVFLAGFLNKIECKIYD